MHVNSTHFEFYKPIKTAFDGRLTVLGRVFKPYAYRTIEHMHEGEEANLTNLINAYLNRFNAISTQLVVHVNCATLDDEGTPTDVINVPLSTRAQLFFSGQRFNVQKQLSTFASDARNRLDALENQGSGYNMRYVTAVALHLTKKDFAGGAGMKNPDMFVSSLSEAEKSAVLDVECHIKDGCLFSAVAQAYLPTDIEDRELRREQTKHFISKYMNVGGIRTPVLLSQLSKFERRNSGDLDFGINVYMKGRRSDHGDFAGCMAEKKSQTAFFFFPVAVSKRLKTCRKVVNLLLVRHPEDERKMHFMYIKDLDRLLNIRCTQTTCSNCLQNVGKSSLQNHLRLCMEHDAQTIKMPVNDEDGNPPRLEFAPGRRRFLNPIIGFCDFECINVELDEEEHLANSTEFEEHVSGTGVFCHQKPIMYTLLFITDQGRVLLEKHCSAESDDIMKRFYTDLKESWMSLFPLLNDRANVRPDLTSEELDDFYNASRCWICEKPFDNARDKFGNYDGKVLDHAHSSIQGGRYLGAAHRSCNLQRRHQSKIPIFIHNLANYDGMFLINAFADEEISKSWTISGIPHNTEKFRCLTVGKFQFLDSLHFLSSSLSKLVDDLVADGHTFPILDQFQHKRLNGTMHKNLLTRKSSYPYDYATSLQVLNSSQYPDYVHFYSKLSEDNISLELWEHGKSVYEQAGCDNLHDYTRLYNRLDVYLLAEVLANFRNHTYAEFRLDVSQFLSSPHLAFNIMLLQNQTPIELVTDVDMHLMTEKGLRGGVTHAALRHVKLEEPYDEQTADTLLYTDCVNLYGCAMKEKLPIGEYTWLSQEEIASRDWTRHSDDDDYGYIVECDLEYPAYLHDFHNSLPLAPEQCEINYAMLSEYSKMCYKQSRANSYKRHKTFKLCSTFLDKENYVVHSKNLSTYLRLGMTLKNVKRAIRFRQRAFLKDYIDLMTKKRQSATSKFGKSFYKLLINSIYGKLVQNVRKQMSCNFVQSEASLHRALKNPCFQHFRIIGEKAAVFFNRKRIIKMNKPYIAGFSVLDISKNHMFELFYDHIKLAAPKAEVVLTDTDSLLITVPNMTKDRFLDSCRNVFDFSNYPRDHPRFDESKKMIPGYLKDENGSKPLVEVVALKAKVYAIRTADDRVEKRCKGVSTRIVERDFTMQTYLTCLSQVSTLRATSTKLRCKNFTIDMITSRKIGLSTGDDKRFLVSENKTKLRQM